MNLVSLLAAPLIVKYCLRHATRTTSLRYSIAGVSVIIIVTAVYVCKRRPIAIGARGGGSRRLAQRR